MVKTPDIASISDDLLFVLTFAGKGKLVLWLSVRDFVDAEPFVRSSQETWQMAFNILDIIETRCQWVVDVDDDNFPIRLFLVE